MAYRGPDADPYATRFGHDTREFDEPTRIGTNPLPDEDNHGPPSICIDDDGHVIAFYGSHGRYHCTARTREPRDVSAWEDLGPMDDVPGGTYPSPIVWDGDIYVLYRAGPSWTDPKYPSARYATIARSTDGTRSFEGFGPILDVTGHPDELDIAYVKDIEERNGRLHISWFICHDHAVPTTAAAQHRSGIYHVIYNPTVDSIYDVAGTRYELPLTWDDMDGTQVEAFDGTDINHPKHVLTDDGPVILYTHFDPASPHFDDGSSRIEWLVSRWDSDHDQRRTERIDGVFATHLFDGGYPRINEAGRVEAHVVTGGRNEELVDDNRGGNFTVATRTEDG